MVRVLLDADGMNARIDLHRVDVLHAFLECDGHVDSRSGADDEHVLGQGAGSLVDEAIDGQRVEPALRSLHRLMWDPVDENFHGPRRLWDEPDLVIG